MKLYIDLIFIVNIWFDFLLLMTVSILLRRNVRIRRLVLGSLIGGLTIFILFFKINSIELFFLKLIISILMILTTFSFKDLKYTFNNLCYLYLTSIILGGGMYLFSNSFSYSSKGFLLYHNGLSINYLTLIILSPIILYFYIKQSSKLKDNYNHYHKVDIIFHNKIYKLNGFLDTGNNLYDQYKKRGIILVNLKLDYEDEEVIYVPYESLNNQGIVKCLKPDKVFVNKKEIHNYLIGISNDKFQIDGIDCILHNNLKGEIT